MSVGSRGPGVIDTGVFGARLTPSGGLLASRYRPVLEGRPAIISFVTVAELEYGARLAGWGPDRLQRLEREIARAEIVWPGPKAGLLRQAGADAVTTGLDEITTALRLAPPPAVRGGAVLSSGSAD
jgi:predicted nucleic acid-binding protein